MLVQAVIFDISIGYCCSGLIIHKSKDITVIIKLFNLYQTISNTMKLFFYYYSQDVFVDFVNLLDMTTSPFQQINRNMLAQIHSIDPKREYNSFINKYKLEVTMIMTLMLINITLL